MYLSKRTSCRSLPELLERGVSAHGRGTVDDSLGVEARAAAAAAAGNGSAWAYPAPPRCAGTTDCGSAGCSGSTGSAAGRGPGVVRATGRPRGSRRRAPSTSGPASGGRRGRPCPSSAPSERRRAARPIPKPVRGRQAAAVGRDDQPSRRAAVARDADRGSRAAGRGEAVDRLRSSVPSSSTSSAGRSMAGRCRGGRTTPAELGRRDLRPRRGHPWRPATGGERRRGRMPVAADVVVAVLDTPGIGCHRPHPSVPGPRP